MNEVPICRSLGRQQGAKSAPSETKTEMKKLLLLLTVTLTALVSNSFADLGDTYAASCQRFGGAGVVYKATKAMYWVKGNYVVYETFVKNRCVILRLVPTNGSWYKISEMENNILPRNKGGIEGEWVRIDSGDSEKDKWLQSWSLNNDAAVAAVYPNGIAQIAYGWYMKAKGLLVTPDEQEPDRAPVEDDAAKTNI